MKANLKTAYHHLHKVSGDLPLLYFHHKSSLILDIATSCFQKCNAFYTGLPRSWNSKEPRNIPSGTNVASYDMNISNLFTWPSATRAGHCHILDHHLLKPIRHNLLFFCSSAYARLGPGTPQVCRVTSDLLLRRLDHLRLQSTWLEAGFWFTVLLYTHTPLLSAVLY